MVQLEGQGSLLFVGHEIGLGIVDGAEQTSGIVGPGHGFAQQRGHGGLGAVGDHLDGVDQVLCFGGQAVEPVGLRQVGDGDVLVDVFALVLEVADQLPQLGDVVL